MTHDELCARAASWLRTNRRCDPVISGVASCREVPDAIGWSSTWRCHGSTVVECKTTRGDFYADAKKYIRYRHPGFAGHFPNHARRARAYKDAGYIAEPVPNMGDFRYFMCEPDVITEAMVKDNRPDHGLLHVSGRRVKVIIEAPRRDTGDKASEVHYLRFAIIHLRDNLLTLGCSVDLTEAVKYFGTAGITMPADRIANVQSANSRGAG